MELPKPFVLLQQQPYEMKWVSFIGLCLTISFFSYGQQVTSGELSSTQIDSVFPAAFKLKTGITFDVYKAFEYHDKAGDHFILMTEHTATTENDAFRKENTEVYHDSIKAYCFDRVGDSLVLKWSLSDFCTTNEFSEEHSISFWTKYFQLDDYDSDGIADPIIVYGSFGDNGTDDGRIRILTYYKGVKYAIRHQNGTLDYERNTKVDQAFYGLPASIQTRVRTIMRNITDNGHGIFPAGWTEAMNSKKTAFDEN